MMRSIDCIMSTNYSIAKDQSHLKSPFLLVDNDSCQGKTGAGKKWGFRGKKEWLWKKNLEGHKDSV